MSNKDEIICNCNQITRGEIEDAIRNKNLKTVDEVGEAVDAGTVCGACQDDIQEILDTLNA